MDRIEQFTLGNRGSKHSGMGGCEDAKYCLSISFRPTLRSMRFRSPAYLHSSLAAGTTSLTVMLIACVSIATCPAASLPVADLVEQYCTDCHNAGKRKGGIDFDKLNPAEPAEQPQV